MCVSIEIAIEIQVEAQNAMYPKHRYQSVVLSTLQRSYHTACDFTAVASRINNSTAKLSRAVVEVYGRRGWASARVKGGEPNATMYVQRARLSPTHPCSSDRMYTCAVKELMLWRRPVPGLRGSRRYHRWRSRPLESCRCPSLPVDWQRRARGLWSSQL